jgi:hypothetical protein
VPAFTTPMLMFSGLLYERSSIPTWLKWIEDISLVNYAFDALLAQQMDILPGNQVGGGKNASTAAMGLISFAYITTSIHNTTTTQSEFLQKFIQFDPKSMGKNIALLWALAAGLQFLTYVNVVLRLRATKVVN